MTSGDIQIFGCVTAIKIIESFDWQNKTTSSIFRAPIGLEMALRRGTRLHSLHPLGFFRTIFTSQNMAPVALSLLVIAVACANAQDTGTCPANCIGQTCDQIIAKSSINDPADCKLLEQRYT